MILIELIIVSLLSVSALTSKLEVTHEWKYADFDWDGFEGDKSSAYDPSAVILYDVDFAQDGRIFVTAVREQGVPASVMIVTDKMGDGGPLLKPYPSWGWYKLGDCDGITSVYRVAIDSCNFMWVLDSGKVGSNTVCPPQILAFHLGLDILIFRKKIPDEVTTYGAALLITPVVEPDENCKNFNIYMADTETYGIVAYSTKTNKFKRSQHRLYRPDTDGTTITVADESFNIQDGVLAMTLGTFDKGNLQVLYFSVLASHRINAVSAHGLFESNIFGTPFVVISDLPSQSAAIAISSPQSDYSRVIFFSQLEYTAIACYNTLTYNNVSNIEMIDSDPETLQFPSGMKIHRYDDYDEIKMFTNRYQKVAAGTFSTKDTNFRILRGNVDQLIKGTKCEASSEDQS